MTIKYTFQAGYGHLIFLLTDNNKVRRQLIDQNIITPAGYFIDPHPDLLLNEIPSLFPNETIKMTKQVAHYIKLYKAVQKIDIQSYQPQSLKLEPHQIDTARKTLLIKKIINADETGLGKTISTIATLNVLYNFNKDDPPLKRLLVIVPPNLIPKWINEFQNYSNIPLTEIKLSGKSFYEIREEFNKNPYAIISIDTLKNYINYIPLTYNAIVVDEIHNSKNSKTQRFNALSKIFAEYKIFLSATPLINSPDELHKISRLLDSSLLGNLYEFEQRYYDIEEINLPNGTTIRNITSIKQSKKTELQHIIGSFMSRNTWKDIGKEIPEHTNEIVGNMTTDQQYIYDFLLKKYRRLSSFNRLELFTYLQEVVNSPHLVKSKIRSIPQYHIDTKKLSHGWKTEHLLNELIPKLHPEDNPIIIFTKFKSYLEILYNLLKSQYPSLTIKKVSGDNTSKSKAKIIQSFQRGEINILVSDDALSYGQDLQKSNILINMELPLSPAIYEQRIGRIKRMGQQNDIYIYNYITDNSIETYIMELIIKKREYFQDLVNETKYIHEELYKRLVRGTVSPTT